MQITAKKLKLMMSIICCCCSNAMAAVVPPPDVKVDTYIVIDHETGTVLAESNSTKHKSIASLTKLMTAYVLFSEIKEGTLSQNELTRISLAAWKAKGSRMFIEEGQSIKIDELLNGLLSVSGNDAAVALAEHVSGSEAEFVNIMNAQARKLNMKDTVYANATGLPTSDEHYSSAKDVAIISSAIIREFPEQYIRFSNKSFEHNNINQPNRNALLFQSPNYDGLKTGYTIDAGYCLSTSFEKNDRRIITIILDAKSTKERFSAAKILTSYGYRNFYNVVVVKEGVAVHRIPVFYGDKSSIGVIPEQGLVMTLPKQLDNQTDGKGVLLTAIFEANEKNLTMLYAPVKKSFVIGKLNITYNDKLIKSIPLITKDFVDEGGWGHKLKDWLYLNVITPITNWFSGFLD